MSLGSDNTTCKREFKEAMRPIAGKNPNTGTDNVDDQHVDPNFGALGQAVYNIATLDAETTSDKTIDAAFWQWVAALDAWQQGVVQAFNNWQPTQPDGQALKAAILAVPTPQSASVRAPTGLKGKII